MRKTKGQGSREGQGTIQNKEGKETKKRGVKLPYHKSTFKGWIL